jgi:hypothetical protein
MLAAPALVAAAEVAQVTAESELVLAEGVVVFGRQLRSCERLVLASLWERVLPSLLLEREEAALLRQQVQAAGLTGY